MCFRILDFAIVEGIYGRSDHLQALRFSVSALWLLSREIYQGRNLMNERKDVCFRGMWATHGLSE